MHDPTQQFEVVPEHEERAHRDEDQESRAGAAHARNAEYQRAHQGDRGDGDEDAARYACVQWSSVHLVERVRGDPDGEEEPDDGRGEPETVCVRRERGADDDVREVPGRVRRMQDGPPVAPAPGTRRVERRARRSHRSGFRAHMTMPPPRLIARVCRSVRPAASHARTIEVTG